MASIRHSFILNWFSPDWQRLVRRSWLLSAMLFASEISLRPARAQTPPQLPPNIQAQLQIQQPLADISLPTSATASFDPPVAKPGETVFYRISVESTESAVQMPEKLPAPLTLITRPVSQGQIIQLSTGRPRPLASFLFEAMATTAGQFTIPQFTIVVDGRPVPVQAATLDVVDSDATNLPSARKLVLQTSETNLFVGQPFKVTVMLPATSANEIEALREVQINGDGLITDRNSIHLSVSTVKYNGQLKSAYIYEIAATPIAAGRLKFSAQAFSAGHEFSGPISITGQVVIRGGMPHYDLLISDPMEITVRPLPAADRHPGFTGSIGKFFFDPPKLSSNRIHVGEPVQLKFAYHAMDSLSRLVPPEPPRSRDWLIMANKPPGTGFTLVPLTDEVHETPVIPFSYFDPEAGKYVDLNIPSLPVSVTGGSLPTQVQSTDNEGQAVPLKLSGLATTPGKATSSLTPLQLRGWFVGLQLLPVFAFVALWHWDRHRRFLEAHPEIVRRRQARRALRREKRNIQQAISAGDDAAFVRHAVNAMKIACAPHYPAHPQALVCGDVLAQLDDSAHDRRINESVQKLFAAADAQFAQSPQPNERLLALQADAAVVLQKLEAKL